jgi:hypothetical protein
VFTQLKCSLARTPLIRSDMEARNPSGVGTSRQFNTMRNSIADPKAKYGATSDSSFQKRNGPEEFAGECGTSNTAEK